MKKILLPVLALILTACASPQVTVTRFAEVTVTSPPSTAATIPTPTLHPQFVTLQEQIADASDKFTLNSSNGLIEFQSESGVVAVDGIRINPDGSGTLTTSEGEVGFDPNGLTFDAKSATFVDETGKSWVWDAKKRLVPAVEVKQFPVCGIENFRECPVTLEDILNGNVMRWLETQKKPFDTDKIKNVPLIWYEGWDRIQYDTRTAPNFTDPATDQQHRDIAMHLQNVVDGVTYNYIYLPVEVYDPATKESHWVQTVSPIQARGTFSAKDAEAWAIKYWHDMNFAPIVTSNLLIGIKTPDPLVGLTFQAHPDMSTRFQNFVSGVDMAALSEPDILLLNFITYDTKHWLQ